MTAAVIACWLRVVSPVSWAAVTTDAGETIHGEMGRGWVRFVTAAPAYGWLSYGDGTRTVTARIALGMGAATHQMRLED